MTTVKLQDNLPITGRLEKVWYQAPKEYSAQLKLVGRWQEHTPNGVVERGPGNLYVNIDLENDLRILGLVEVGTDASNGEPTYRVLKPGPIRILKAPTGDGNKRRTTITLVDNAAPSPAAAATPVPQSAPAPTAPPAAAPSPANQQVTPAERRRMAFADWVSQGDALTAGLALAAHAARVAGVETTPESLQAGAATILIRAERTGLTAWRGLGDAMAKYLADKKAPTPRPATTPADMKAELDRRRGAAAPAASQAMAGSLAGGRGENDEQEEEDDDLPF